MIATSLIGLILNLIAYVFFMTMWSIDMFSEWAPSGGLLILFTIVAVCLDIYIALALANFFVALRKGESGSDLPYRTKGKTLFLPSDEKHTNKSVYLKQPV